MRETLCIADTNLVAAFDWLALSWEWKVLQRDGIDQHVVRRVQNLYQESITIVVVNNQHSRVLLDNMVLSDSLEMIGVELKATWSQTRKVNGDIIQARVSSIINAWKSGKFMVIEHLCSD